MSDRISNHYDSDYFNWQAPIGEFGGWANQTKFLEHVKPDQVVLDFGCGGGFLLKGLNCKRRLGVEVNPAAAENARKNGLEVYNRVADVPEGEVDLVISNNALEHTLQPLEELKGLHEKLKPGGKAVFVVPCESIFYEYKPDDVNHHLFTWSPMCIGNLFTEAGFSVIESKAYIHKWPPRYRFVAKFFGRRIFEIGCRIYGRIERSWFQVRVVAQKQP